MTSPKILTLLLSLVSTGSGVCYLTDNAAPRKAAVSSLPPAYAWQAPDFVGPLLGAGVVVRNHSYNLVAPSRGHIQTISGQPGQHVRRGEVLVKLAPTAFVVAPADGIVTQYLAANGEYVGHAAPVARFTELTPFRLRLPQSAAGPQLAPGQFLQVQSAADARQGVTATVVGSAPAGEFLLVDVRVRTASPEPLPADAPVVVHALLLTP